MTTSTVFISCGAAAQPATWPPHSWGFQITHKDGNTVGMTPLMTRSSHTSTWQHSTLTTNTPLGYEPTISTGERPQIYALDRAATGTGKGTYSDTGLDSLIISWNISECITIKILLFRKYLIQILFGWPGAMIAGFPRSLQVDIRTQK